MKNLIFTAIFGIFALNFAYAQNAQEYVQTKQESNHFIDLSREQVSKNNLTLAKAYAKKAIQADAWNKKAWENYEDIVQRLADEGLLDEFGANADESEATNTPSAGGAAQFEGC